MKKKKVALVAVNSRTSHTNLALYYIKKILNSDAQCDCSLIELTINENWKYSLEKLTEETFEYYLFSVYIWNCDYIKELASMIKEIRPGSKIILGGPEVSYNMNKWIESDIADTLINGQAEGFIPSLFTFDEKIFYSKSTPINEIPFPYETEDYGNLKGRLVYYEASRGCLFNCSYCLSSCSDQKLEYRDIETVKRDLLTLISIKPKIVKMVDRTFNSKREYAREIWRFLIEQKSPVPFHFEVHPLFLEEEDFTILKEAPDDLFHFEVGIQSTCEDVLTAVDRPYNWSVEKKNVVALCSLKNIHTHLDQIVGLPEDNRERAIESFNEILSIKPDEFQLGFLKILPGTSMSQKVDFYKMAVNSAPPYEVIQTSTMTFEEIKEFYSVERDLNRFYNSHYLIKSLEFLMGLSGTPWSFFTKLNEFSPEDKTVKQWQVLGKSLMLYCEKYHHEHKEYIFDLLRLDWCPFASGQNYPNFLRIDDRDLIKTQRRTAYSYFSEKIEGFSRRDFNHSILFVPRSKRLIKKMNNNAFLFYRANSIQSYEITLENLQSVTEND